MNSGVVKPQGQGVAARESAESNGRCGGQKTQQLLIISFRIIVEG